MSLSEDDATSCFRQIKYIEQCPLSEVYEIQTTFRKLARIPKLRVEPASNYYNILHTCNINIINHKPSTEFTISSAKLVSHFLVMLLFIPKRAKL
jgi:hypothetical protein